MRKKSKIPACTNAGKKRFKSLWTLICKDALAKIVPFSRVTVLIRMNFQPSILKKNDVVQLILLPVRTKVHLVFFRHAFYETFQLIK